MHCPPQEIASGSQHTPSPKQERRTSSLNLNYYLGEEYISQGENRIDD